MRIPDHIDARVPLNPAKFRDKMETRLRMVQTTSYSAEHRATAVRQLGELTIGYLEQHGTVADLVEIQELLEQVLRDAVAMR